MLAPPVARSCFRNKLLPPCIRHRPASPPPASTPACRGGKLRTNEFTVADRGPRQGVPPEWVPQLQLHMLCAGEAGPLGPLGPLGLPI